MLRRQRSPVPENIAARAKGSVAALEEPLPMKRESTLMMLLAVAAIGLAMRDPLLVACGGGGASLLYAFYLRARKPSSRQGLHAHAVFFTLKDDSTEAIDRLIASCERWLREHEGVEHFSAGKIAPWKGLSSYRELPRPLNQRDFHVSLHMTFSSRNAYDDYQKSSPARSQFVEENKDNFETVRVFDSAAVGGVP